jgi:hypothetical protein
MRRLTLLLCLLAFAAAGTAADKALDRDGNLYFVVPATVNEAPVLQMQILFSSGVKTFMTVPGSEGPELESSPQVYLSSNARNLYVAYERTGADSGGIVLATYAIGSGFGVPVTLAEPGAGVFCRNPRLVQTHEIRVDEAGTKTILQFLHLLWWETGARPGAVYCNIPVVLGTLDLDFRTEIRLNDLTDPSGVPGDLSGISPQLYEAPAFYAPLGNSNHLYILFADLGALQYRVLEFRYSLEGDTLRDRAHFPDIGVRNSIALPSLLSPTQSVSAVIGLDARIGLFSMEPNGTLFALYCDAWTTPMWLPSGFNPLEVGNLLRSLVDDLQ